MATKLKIEDAMAAINVYYRKDYKYLKPNVASIETLINSMTDEDADRFKKFIIYFYATSLYQKQNHFNKLLAIVAKLEDKNFSKKEELLGMVAQIGSDLENAHKSGGSPNVREIGLSSFQRFESVLTEGLNNTNPLLSLEDRKPPSVAGSSSMWKSAQPTSRQSENAPAATSPDSNSPSLGGKKNNT